MRVYFDICAIQRPLDDHAQLRVRLEAEAMVALLELCESGRIELAISTAHEIENSKNPHPERREHTETVLAVAQHHALTTPEVAQLAAIYKRAGLKRLDALHLASAVVSNAAFFCTTDDKLLRRGRSLDTNACSVVTPLDLILELDFP
jgi:predicted nucleic acid-binding protein